MAEQSSKVLVTGASGFIGKHIVRELLENGYPVRGSVRSDKREAEVRALFDSADLEFVHLDLNSDDGWAEALDGVDMLIHSASPIPAEEPKDPQVLIRPAVDGTRRALKAAEAAGVHRIVLTSSCAAIYKDSAKPPAQVSTAANWTDPDADYVTGYEASKTLAEKAAWDFVADHPEMQLTTINPGVVFGPALDPNYGTSLEIVEQFLDGKFPMCPDMNVPAVDVRDVARCHVEALSTPESIGNRYPLNAGAVTFLGMAKTLSEAFPDKKIPIRSAPNWLVKVMAVFIPLMKTVAMNLGRNSDVEAGEAEQAFGFTYVPRDEALLEAARYIETNR